MILRWKIKFQRYKNPIFLEDADIDEVLVSNKISFGEKDYKYFTGDLNGSYNIKLLQIILPKTSAYVKSCDGKSEWMFFLIEDDDLLEKYTI